jgi:hypothetical protein
MATVRPWCRVTLLGVDGTAVAWWVLDGPGAPDLGAVDEVARLKLMVGRVGGSVALTDLSPAFRELLDLAGIRVEVEGKPELGEESFDIQMHQEQVHPGDLPS